MESHILAGITIFVLSVMIFWLALKFVVAIASSVAWALTLILSFTFNLALALLVLVYLTWPSDTKKTSCFSCPPQNELAITKPAASNEGLVLVFIE